MYIRQALNGFHRCSRTAALGLGLVGCSTGPLANQSEKAASIAQARWSTDQRTDAVEVSWVATFDSPELSQLIAEAIAGNFGLDAAEARTNATQAAARIARAGRFPTLGLGLSSSKQQSRFAFLDFQEIQTDTHSLSLSSQWEVDLWNRLGRRQAAAVADLQSSLAELVALKLSLAGQVAKAYFALADAAGQLDLAEDNTENFATLLQVVERRFDRGLVPALDLRLTQAQVASSQAAARQSEIDRDLTQRQLETLLARYPAGDIAAASELPPLGPPVPAGLPSELLNRRPDLVARERQLAAAVAREGIAQRNWLPSLNLTGSIGTTSDELTNVLDTELSVWSIASEIAAPIFRAGALKAERRQSKALQEAALADYRDAVLNAFREVETALFSEEKLRQLVEATSVAVAENEQAEKLVWEQYDRGLADITAVLDTQRRAFDSASQHLSVRSRLLQNRVDLFIALGGNFGDAASLFRSNPFANSNQP